MRIWIKGPCVAIGVLAAFLLLSSTAVSEETSDDNTSTVPLYQPTEISVTDEQQLMHLPFADKLSNICDLQNERASSTPIVGHRVHFELEFLRHILVYVNFTKRSALEVLQNHTISNCATLHINNLPHTPRLDELKEGDIKGALNKIYSSLLIHSGYSYFISHQFESNDLRCSENVDGGRRLADLSRDLAEKQRFLACRLQLGMKMLGYYLEDASSVLNERVSDFPQCSLRSLRDCQVMKSINNFLQVFGEYVSDYISASTAS